MDAYEATRIVYSRIQSLDPENAAKIMGLLLIQDHGEKEMIRLAFGPEALVHSVVLKARKDLGLLPSTPSTPSSPSPFSRQNTTSRLLNCGSGLPSPSSWAPPPVFSRTNSTNANGGSLINGVVDDLSSADELISSSLPYMTGTTTTSTISSSPVQFYGGDLIDELQLQDQLSFLNDPSAAVSSPSTLHGLPIGPKSGSNGGDLFYSDLASECRSPSSNGGDGMMFPYGGVNWGVNGHHRRSCSMADLYLSSDASGGFGWKPCLYFARGYCKNGSSCRFQHGLPDDAATMAAMAGSKMDSMVEQQCQELLMRSKSQRLGSASQLMASAASFPYAASAPSPTSGKCMNFLLQQQQQQSENQRAAAAAALMLDDPHKFVGRSRLDRLDYAGMVNPGSRQIYLTFPADSTFREEDVSNYFSIYGPVQDVRIPYQQKRMFGFVTFVYPETVKLILAKGNPHFVCDARVLVKPYKEKGKVPDKKHQQQLDRVDFSGCSTPPGLDTRDPYDLQQLGVRVLFNNSQEVLLRRKLEEQQQAAELQQAIELQGRRFMGLQLLDLKNRSLSLPITSFPSPSPINTPTTNTTPTTITSISTTDDLPPPEDKCPSPVTAGAQEQQQQAAVNSAPSATASDKEESVGAAAKGSPKEDSDFQESAEHNLPDSPFASPTKSSFKGVGDAFSEDMGSASPSLLSSNSSNHLMASSTSLLSATPTLDMASFKSCFLHMPRFSSGRGAVGM